MLETTEKPNEQAAGLRLTCDTMLGKLSRELRKLGVDVEYHRGSGGMRGYNRAREQNRVFLTRSNRLRELPDVVFVDSNDPGEQLVQVRAKFAFAAGPTGPAGPPAEPAPGPATEVPANRCHDCNVALEKISRDQARPAIPFFVYQIHHDFSRCPKCKRVFWPGSNSRDEQQRAAAGRPRPRRGRGDRRQ
jgi:hypothetical protein